MQSIARDSDDSSDDEFFDAHGMWNLNHLVHYLKWWDKRAESMSCGDGSKTSLLCFESVPF